MRVLHVLAPAAVAIALAGATAAAQEIEPLPGSDPAGAAAPQGLDPDAPVSSDSRSGAAAGDTASGDAGSVGAEPYAVGPYAGGLPERAAPPRTLRAHWHVFIAFAIVWLLLFGYALSVGRRFGRLEDEVRRLGGPGA